MNTRLPEWVSGVTGELPTVKGLSGEVLPIVCWHQIQSGRLLSLYVVYILVAALHVAFQMFLSREDPVKLPLEASCMQVACDWGRKRKNHALSLYVGLRFLLAAFCALHSIT